MDATTVTCPKCQGIFPLTAAIEQPIIERLRAQYEAESVKREKKLETREREIEQRASEVDKIKSSVNEEVEKRVAEGRGAIVAEEALKARDAVSVQLRDLQVQLSEQRAKIDQARREELAILKLKRDLEEERSAFDLDKTAQIEKERTKIREEAKKAALDETAVQVRELQETLSLKSQKLQESQDAELKLRKQKAEFEEEKRAFELEVARRGEEIRNLVKKEKDEEFRLKEAENERRTGDLKRQLDEMKRKMEQGSQQSQGEVLEVDLENSLRRCFISDEIVPVEKGVKGADVLQHVKDELGHPCGIIIWESKRQKAWNDKWLAKIKEDKLEAKARVAVLITVVMPKDAASFECREDVWIAPPSLAMPLAGALRGTLISTAAAQRAMEGRQEKEATVYDYLSGPEFKGRVQAIVDAFKDMQDDLRTEKLAYQRIWTKREKQIERVVTNTVGLYADVGGIIGKSLPVIRQLELPGGMDSDNLLPASP